MAAASDSNDASDIFWPGYVDAVVNLAINLLFVIAVMAIVVLTTVLQIQKLKPEDYVPKAPESLEAVQSPSKSEQESASQAASIVQSAQQLQQLTQALQAVMQQSGATNATQKTTETAKLDGATEQSVQALLSTLNQTSQELAPGNLQRMLADKAAAEKLSAEQEQALKKLQRELQALKTGQAQQRNPMAAADDVGGTGDISGRADVVTARQTRQAPKTGESQVENLNSGGLIVVFDTDVIELSDKEVSELVLKMAQIRPLNQGRWLLQVVSPKGFSEATRLAYYRVNTVRNALLANGVSAAAIDMRVVESEGSGANNARVLVRPVSP